MQNIFNLLLKSDSEILKDKFEPVTLVNSMIYQVQCSQLSHTLNLVALPTFHWANTML